MIYIFRKPNIHHSIKSHRVTPRSKTFFFANFVESTTGSILEPKASIVRRMTPKLLGSSTCVGNTRTKRHICLVAPLVVSTKYDSNWVKLFPIFLGWTKLNIYIVFIYVWNHQQTTIILYYKYIMYIRTCFFWSAYKNRVSKSQSISSEQLHPRSPLALRWSQVRFLGKPPATSVFLAVERWLNSLRGPESLQKMCNNCMKNKGLVEWYLKNHRQS